jgi:hypothetical protein
LINKAKIYADILEETQRCFTRRMTINKLIPAIVMKAVDSVIEEIEKNGQSQTPGEQEDSPKEASFPEGEATSNRRGRPPKATEVKVI